MASLLHFSLLLLLISLSHSLSSSTSPLTPKSNLFPYWSRKITTTTTNSHQQSQPPPFFTSKLSPLSPLEVATFSSLAPSNLSSNLPSFCAAARLLCSPSNYAANLATSPDVNKKYNNIYDANLPTDPHINGNRNYAANLPTNSNPHINGNRNYAANLPTNPNPHINGNRNYAANLRDNPNPHINGNRNYAANLPTNPNPHKNGNRNYAANLPTNPNPDLNKKYNNIYANDDMKALPLSYVEPGMYFRERELTKGTVMPMPDIRDNAPARSFLPRAIASKIPFSAGEAMSIFNIPADSAMGLEMNKTISDCRLAPSRGETKRCATSAEDMIDFAVSVLGPNVAVRSMENTKGLKGDILIGDVKGVDNGKITKSVSCHESVFPYLVYFCHSVPKVRVYEADILDASTKQKINHGVAICHLDTSDWSAGHYAFVLLGSAPGKIEVCHWIAHGGMNWAIAA